MLSEKVLMKVENETGLYRDPVSKVVINKDKICDNIYYYTYYIDNKETIPNINVL